jgi:hypothetical protein
LSMTPEPSVLVYLHCTQWRLREIEEQTGSASALSRACRAELRHTAPVVLATAQAVWSMLALDPTKVWFAREMA